MVIRIEFKRSQGYINVVMGTTQKTIPLFMDTLSAKESIWNFPIGMILFPFKMVGDFEISM